MVLAPEPRVAGRVIGLTFGSRGWHEGWGKGLEKVEQLEYRAGRLRADRDALAAKEFVAQ